MKKHIAVLLPFVLTFLQSNAQTVVRNENLNQNYNYQQSVTFIANLDRKAEAMKQNIRKTQTKVNIQGKSYYVAANGNNANDGLSPKKPLKDLSKVNSLDLQAGDAVLLRRGDLWRGYIKSKNGVTYSAYGKGEKPKIYGSLCDAAKEGKWIATETPNVYIYDMELPNDIGTLVFNDGASCAVKVLKEKLQDGLTVHLGTKEPFTDYRDLKVDLEFYHDYKDAKRLYLYSSKGNPAKRFKSIELLVKTNIIYAKDNVTIDNLCLKYSGAHGIGSGTTKGLTVTNCEIGWIGGSIQGENLYGRSFPTRYGNGIEVYGGCAHYLVDNCYIYQVYDAGITHQFSTGGNEPIVMKDIVYSNNLVEDCVIQSNTLWGKLLMTVNDIWIALLFITIYYVVPDLVGGCNAPTKKHRLI